MGGGGSLAKDMTGQQSAGGSWSCGGQAFRQVSEVRYLGAIFQSGQGFLPSMPSASGTGSSRGSMALCSVRRACG